MTQEHIRDLLRLSYLPTWAIWWALVLLIGGTRALRGTRLLKSAVGNSVLLLGAYLTYSNQAVRAGIMVMAYALGLAIWLGSYESLFHDFDREIWNPRRKKIE